MHQDSKIIKLQKQRRNIELNQIKSILADFAKTKSKCIELANKLNEQMPKQQFFNNFQRSALRKMDLLDLTGLVNLKNQLVRASTELFQIERQLRYKKEKSDARKQMSKFMQNGSTSLKKIQILSRKQEPLKQKIQQNFQSLITEIKKSQQLFQSKPKNKNLQIPLYRVKNQSNQNKIDRISKYIASLKRNVKLNSQTPGYKWKIKQFLMQDQTYLQIRSQIEKFRMNQEELDYIYCQILQQEIRQYLKGLETIETNEKYKVVKIYKTKKHNENLKENLNNDNLIQLNSMKDEKIIQNRKPSKTTISIEQQIRKSNDSTKNTVQMKALQDFDSIKKQLQKSNQTYFQMLSKINESVQKGSEKLSILREKRKKKTTQLENNIWDQLDKI